MCRFAIIFSVFFTFLLGTKTCTTFTLFAEAILAVQFFPPQELEIATSLINVAELAFRVHQLHRFPRGTQKLL